MNLFNHLRLFDYLQISLRLVVFLAASIVYSTTNQLSYSRSLFGGGLTLAKASGTVLQLDIALLFAFGCTRLDGLSDIPKLRKLVYGYLQFERTRAHRLCAFSMVLFSLFHMIGHFAGFATAGNRATDGKLLKQLLLSSSVAITGYISICLLLFMSVAALAPVRKLIYSLFRYTHLLYIPLLVIWTAHASLHVIRINNGAIYSHGWGWLVWLPFGLACFAEKLYSLHQIWYPAKIVAAAYHPTGVIELSLNKAGFIASPGQYVHIRCPEISLAQDHPFSCTSSCDDSGAHFYIKSVGGFTNNLCQKLCHTRSGFDTADSKSRLFPTFLLSGPHGPSLTLCTEYDTCLLIANGVGLTPFISLFNYLLNMSQQQRSKIKLTKVHLYWICSSFEAAEWAIPHLQKFESNLGTMMFKMKMFISSEFELQDVEKLMSLDADSLIHDPVTHLQSRTWYGKPHWSREFENLAAPCKEQLIVITSGSSILSGEVRRNLVAFTRRPESKTQVHMHHVS
ncbi:hypothetical protein CANCADRAFT_44412 [Tortispora caseinolytica NRRL Y-17796]|uniref:FAD-binding FR-type domain-containing protein n=1 Tax=Tortispora caseinolytica NRRL Y-17796 TaxID=767744 RepID=A0A1E4TG80_9ASCO|nr:hypothetical protein CANCADRAFT_44412 [Tortispora caseinolytica NRRL Y-17796]